MIDKILYGLHGLAARLSDKPECPACGGLPKATIDSKYFHQLVQCASCNLLFRFPRETEHAMNMFYQRKYIQAGLTTELPDDETLSKLTSSNFIGTSKEFSQFIILFNALGVESGSRVLDFGANWGYAMYQFKKAGFEISGYEISKPRAEFGRKLDLNILTNWPEVCAFSPFDISFSAHVLEHTPNPAEAIQRQIDVLKPGGYLVAVFPHGSGSFREKSYESFHRLWGRVHPVLPTVEFLQVVLPTSSWFIGAMTEEDLDAISAWDGVTPTIGDTTRSELLVIYRA